jgi:hypothetical protein
MKSTMEWSLYSHIIIKVRLFILGYCSDILDLIFSQIDEIKTSVSKLMAILLSLFRLSLQLE